MILKGSSFAGSVPFCSAQMHLHKSRGRALKEAEHACRLAYERYISHVLNKQGTGYEFLQSIELKNEARHVKEHPKISKFTKFESYWFKLKSMVLFRKG